MPRGFLRMHLRSDCVGDHCDEVGKRVAFKAHVVNTSSRDVSELLSVDSGPKFF